MARLSGVVLGAAAAGVFMAAAGASAQGDSTGKGSSTLAGVYSEKQATRGEAVYQKFCLECHVPTDYSGDAFQSKFVGGTAFDMFEQIRSSMPQSDPGSLTKEQYTDLVAYLFSLNELPTRTADMPAVPDSLKAIKVEAKPPGSHQTHGAATRHGSSRIRQARRR